MTFEDLVLLDVKGETSAADVSYLTDNLEDWILQLNNLLRDIDIQFMSHKAALASMRLECAQSGDETKWLDATAKNLDWKLKASRYRAAIESRLRYAKSLRVKD